MADGLNPVNRIVKIARLRHAGRMQRILIALGLVAGLAACSGPLSIYYRPGADVSRMQRDTTNCEVAALKDAPVATEIRERPPVYVPGPVYCDAYGNCRRGFGYWVSGGVYTVDRNADLRGRVTDQCMADRGYSPAQVPACPVGLSAPPQRTTTLPTLTPQSCAIRYDDGSFQR